MNVFFGEQRLQNPKDNIDQRTVRNMLEVLCFQTIFVTIEKLCDLNSGAGDGNNGAKVYLKDLPPLPLTEFKQLIPDSFIQSINNQL